MVTTAPDAFILLPQVVINEEPCGMRDAPQNCDLFLEVKEQVRAGITVLWLSARGHAGARSSSV
jgi:hypothetical protein